jgi:(S)-2-hydroxyglutarate dehydrogenase
LADATDHPRMADVLVVGGGVLGVAISYWLSCLYDCRIVLVDKEADVAGHASSRNTGVVHRPFYLNPRTKGVFARSADASYSPWRTLARDFGLPWKQVGTLEVAVTEEELRVLEKYMKWGAENGVEEEELELLDGSEARALEPRVECRGALLSKTDASVDFGGLTRALKGLASSNGVQFLGGAELASVKGAGGAGVDVALRRGGGVSSFRSKVLVNAAGGGALRIAHDAGLAKEYSALHFRGEYWVVAEPMASSFGRNVYTPPLHPEFPFLDPHFVVRADGARQIGPNAAMVTGPYVYRGYGLSSASRLFEAPLGPKARLLTDGGFLTMVAGEWLSSVSKRVMCGRVRKFIPGLSSGMLAGRGLSGVRSSLVGPGGFVPEALILFGEASAHILNFNSPGATGAPSYSALVVSEMQKEGLLDGLRGKRSVPAHGWDFGSAVGLP